MPSERAVASEGSGFVALCPLVPDGQLDQSCATAVRTQLRALPLDEDSPFAKVPDLYMCRMFVLDDATFQTRASSVADDHLQSKYLVFAADLYGELDGLLEALWRHTHHALRNIFRYCLGFYAVHNTEDFIRYMRKCQVPSAFYVSRENAPLSERLKALYIKQEFAKFARAHQGQDAITLQLAFSDFVARVAPENLARPTWRRGASNPNSAAQGERLRS